MAKEAPPTEQKPAAAAPPSKPIAIKKLLVVGVPVFLVQLGILFFVATKFVSGPSSGTPPAQAGASAPAESGAKGEEGAEAGARMFIVKDLIVNPAGTNGTRYLLLTVGIEASTSEGVKELEKKEIQVRDALNTVLTTKGLDELASVERREDLRTEIQTKVGSLVKAGSVTNVYFSKFIIQ
jgi:flagellar FliL protein